MSVSLSSRNTSRMNLPPLRDDASTRAGSVADRSRVSSVAEHIHSSYARASLLRQAEEKKARKVRFYRNGDKFYRGAVFAVSPERFRTFDSLLAELTRSPICDPKLMPNGVRYVFSLDGSRKILSLDELQEGESYVCATLDVFKDIDYTKTLSPTAWHQSSRVVRSGAASAQLLQSQQQTLPQSELPPLAGAPLRHTPPAVGGASGAAGLVGDGDAAGALASDEAAFVECIKPRLITVIRSGPRPRMSVRIPLNKRTARSLEQVLRGVSDIIRLDSGSVRRMYALSGRQVYCLADFFLEDTIFLAFGNERPSSDDFHLDTNEVRLVCAYRFSASTKADRVTLRSQSSARMRPSRQLDTAATDQWSLQMRSLPSSPMVTRRQPRAAASDVRPRLAEERTDAPTFIRRLPSVQGGDRVPQEVQPASNSSSEANSDLLNHSARALTLSAAEAATEVVEAAASDTVDVHNGVQTGDGDARILMEQKRDRTTSITAATGTETSFYNDEKRDDHNESSDNVAADNAMSPDAGSQMSYAAADAASTATARTDEGGESLPLDDDEHDLSSGDGSGVDDFSEPSAGGSVLSRISTFGSENGGQSLDLHADDEGSGVEKPSGLDTKDIRQARSNSDQGSEQTFEEQQSLPQRSQQQERDQQPQPPRPELPRPQRRPHHPLANGHVVRELRPVAGDNRRADVDSMPEARPESGTLNEPLSSLGNSTSPPFDVATSATVNRVEAESSTSNDLSKGRQPTLPSASSSLQPEVATATHDTNNDISAEPAAFVPLADELTSNATAEAHSLENKLTVKTGAAFDVAVAADPLAGKVAPASTGTAVDHLAVEHSPTSIDTAKVKAQVAVDQTKAASELTTVNDTENDSSAGAAEGTAVITSRPWDDASSGTNGTGISNQLVDAADTEAVAAVTMVADSQADKSALYLDAQAKDNEVVVATNHKATVLVSDKAAANGLQNGVAAEATAATTASTDRSEIEIETGAASDSRERESAAEMAATEALAADNPLSEEIAHNAAAGATPLAEIAHSATEKNRTENQAAPDTYTVTAEAASDATDKIVHETAVLLDIDSKNKGKSEGSSRPESTSSGHDAEVVPADADVPAAKDKGVADAELSGVSDDARKRIEHRVEGDDEGDQLVLGRYQVLKTIADDGFLTIKECVSRDTGSTLALKVVSKSSSTAEELQAISKEARLLLDVNNMNIIGLVDGFETRKAWYLVTDLDEGLDVVSAILTAQTYSEADAASLFGDLLNALQFLHSKNVVHGSVCIEKLLVVAAPTQSAQAAPMLTGRRLKLGGFSSAATAEETMAASSETEGARRDKDTRVSPASSTEGARRRVSRIADLVAAGEVLWTLLTGRAIPVDSRLKQVDIIEETMKLGVSQEAKNLLNALLEAGTISGLHTAEEALSHTWFARVTATPDATFSKYHEDRKEAIAKNARANFIHRRKYSNKAAAINILKTTIRSEDAKNSRESGNKHLMTESDSGDESTSATATAATALATSVANAFSVDATPTGDVHQLALASPIASKEKSLQSDSMKSSLTSTRDGSVDANQKSETIGAAASVNSFSSANRLESSLVPKAEQASAAQRAADVQQAIAGKVNGQIHAAPHDAVEERLLGPSKPVGGIFEDEDEYF